MSPNQCFQDVPKVVLIIAIDPWPLWTLPTCSNMPYTASIPTIVCLVWPLEALRDPDEPETVFSERFQSDITVIDPTLDTSNLL